jgi:hypothetical protein
MDCRLIFYVGPFFLVIPPRFFPYLLVIVELIKQSAKGETKKQWSTPTLQFRDFVITPDGERIIAATAHVRRHNDDPKPKPSMSGRAAHDPSNGIIGGVVEEFGYEEMEHGIVVVNLGNKKIEA